MLCDLWVAPFQIPQAASSYSRPDTMRTHPQRSGGMVMGSCDKQRPGEKVEYGHQGLLGPRL